ncbi:MAG TPA: hypothetical protein PLV21_18985 [Cyclobacteriaceae bacterium]|nr:hypothetical protein [Cyclobacteriaceae bacterium]HRJ83978.1 hypothetical protein [Cyclobacteriaceae bacterium]
MITLMEFFRYTLLLLLLCLSLNISCSGSNASLEIVLVGSTPGDESIKSMLSISADTKADFIRWCLKLDSKNDFVLNITYGESQPNTLGFKGDGRKQIIKGTYLITKNPKNNHFKEVYQLKSNDLSEKISFVKINENLFHILTPQSQLMVGNGGWSYSLYRKDSVNSGEILLSSPIPDDKSLQLVFDGRTPCREIATAHPEMNASSSCFKLKWRLILKRDSITFLPTTCTIRTIVDNQPRDVSGRWTIINGTVKNPEVIIYKIQVDNLTEPILFLVGDENVLFFLDKNYKPFIGNDDFGFAMNKRVQ